jgi:hypothetical protein
MGKGKHSFAAANCRSCEQQQPRTLQKVFRLPKAVLGGDALLVALLARLRPLYSPTMSSLCQALGPRTLCHYSFQLFISIRHSFLFQITDVYNYHYLSNSSDVLGGVIYLFSSRRTISTGAQRAHESAPQAPPTISKPHIDRRSSRRHV